MTVFGDVPLLLEDTYLAPKPFILPRQLAVLGRDHIRVAVCIQLLVQGRQADPHFIRDLTPRKPAGQRDPHRILAKFSVLPVPMVHIRCCTLRDQRSGTKPLLVHGDQQTLDRSFRHCPILGDELKVAVSNRVFLSTRRKPVVRLAQSRPLG